MAPVYFQKLIHINYDLMLRMKRPSWFLLNLIQM